MYEPFAWGSYRLKTPMRTTQRKVALITGAGRGLGWGIAKAFGLAGTRVCATDVNLDELELGSRQISDDGSEIMFCHLDVADKEEFSEVAQKVFDQWGRIDVLVHAAAVMPLISFEDTSYETWWWELGISLGGLFNGAKATWEIMKGQGEGHIIGVASGASFRGFVNEIAYCVGKHGQEGFVTALAEEAATYNISLNTISPGKSIKPTGVTQNAALQMPNEVTARWTHPADLGRAFVWLANQDPKRFTGLSFSAGTVVEAIDSEGWDFNIVPAKVTSEPQEMIARLEWQNQQRQLRRR